LHVLRIPNHKSLTAAVDLAPSTAAYSALSHHPPKPAACNDGSICRENYLEGALRVSAKDMRAKFF